MQKLAKRVAQAQRQAGRRAQKAAKTEQTNYKLRNQQAFREAVSEVRQNLKDARRARKEDWELGPLAPKRDLGYNQYGMFSESVRTDWSNYGFYTPRPEILEKRCAWAGGLRQFGLAVSDRVVIMDGPDKGKIDRIRAINLQSGSVTLENHHRVRSYGPLAMLRQLIESIGNQCWHVWQRQPVPTHAYLDRFDPPRLPHHQLRDWNH